eukprot:Opistho-2@30389
MAKIRKDDRKYDIREVWEYNLEDEMAAIRQVIQNYPYLAMDTEFPGIVARPIGNFRSTAEYHYQSLRCNVDLLKIIQLGITFADDKGNVPRDACTWQFNFKFSLTEDMYAQDSIDLLTRSGINFKRFEQDGVDVQHFAELLIPSGVVLNESVRWISFHSGYDFAYLLKVLTCQPLPSEENEFFDLLRLYFPCLYDIKYLMKSCKTLKGGLQEVADDLEVERVGPQHQAGSDSMLTCFAFFKMRQVFFEERIDDSKYLGHLYGLGAGAFTGGYQNQPYIVGTNGEAHDATPSDRLDGSVASRVTGNIIGQNVVNGSPGLVRITAGGHQRGGWNDGRD